MLKVSTTTAICAAIFAATIIIAGAQTSPNSQTRLDAHVETSGTAQRGQVQGGQMRASKILGSALYTALNTKIGKVSELIIDKDGNVAAVIVDVAFVGFGEKFVAVSLGDITVGDSHLMLDLTIDELQQMASYKLEGDTDGAGAGSQDLRGQLTKVPAQ